MIWSTKLSLLSQASSALIHAVIHLGESTATHKRSSSLYEKEPSIFYGYIVYCLQLHDMVLNSDDALGVTKNSPKCMLTHLS